MRYLEQLAAASDNLIKRHAPAANKTSPTKQSQLFTKMEAQVNTHTFMRLSMTKSTPPPQKEVEIPPSPRVTLMDTPSPRVHNAILNLITIPDSKNTNEDEPIVSHKRNFTQTPTPPLPTAPTNGLS